MSAFGGKADSARRRTHGLILTGHAMTSAPLRIRWQAANKMGADATVPSGQQAPNLLKWGVALGHSEWAYAYLIQLSAWLDLQWQQARHRSCLWPSGSCRCRQC